MKKVLFGLSLTILMAIIGCDTSKKKSIDITEEKGDGSNTQIDSLGIEKILKEFNIYFGNEQVGFLSPLIGNVPPGYVKSFFTSRDSVFDLINSTQGIETQYKDINYSSVKSITIGDLLKICNGDTNGDVLFVTELDNNKNLSLNILGKTSNTTAIDIDTPNLQKPFIPSANTTAFYTMASNYKKEGIMQYKKFDVKTQYSSFSKANTKNWLTLIKSALNLKDSTLLYVHIGFSGGHGGILVTTYKNLESNYVRLNDDDDKIFAFGNKNGTCCPPQY